MTNRRRWIGVSFLVFGLGIAALYGFVLKRGRDAATWPTTPGRIVDRTVVRTTAKRKKYRPQVTFAFLWDGTERTSTTLSGDFVERTYSSEEEAAAAAAEFVPNQTVTVYVDVGQPERSVLRTGVQPETHWLLVGVVVCLALGWANVRTPRAA